jgi:hypothetical protein
VELIALTDNLGLVELFQEFVGLLPGGRSGHQWCIKIAMRWSC